MEDRDLLSLEGELGRFSPAILAEFQRAVPVARGTLTDDEFFQWAHEGIAIAGLSYRTWEAASEYFKATPRVVERLSFANFMLWAQVGEGLARESSPLASAYFRASNETLYYLSPPQLEEWVRIGRGLYRDTWRSSTLSARFFETSPRIMRYLSLDELELCADFLQALADNSYDFANDCLSMAPDVFAGMEKGERRPFLDLALVLARRNWGDAKAYFAQGPRILSRVERGERNRFLALAHAVDDIDRAYAPAFLFDGSHSLSGIEGALHGRLLDLFHELLATSATAAIEFLKNAPTVVQRVGISGMGYWFEEGRAIIEGREEAGEAFFRLESARGEALLERLSSAVELGQVGEVLRMYARALTGRNVQLLSTEKLTERGIGWTQLDSPSTEGTAVYLPPVTDRYDSKEDNFAWYKVMVTHQAGHLEFDSFQFCFEREAALFPNRRSRLEGDGGTGITDLERFYDLFPNRRLATDIFTAVEDSRIDSRLRHEYAGIRRAYERVQGEALALRPLLYTLPLKEAFVELLVQMSLGDLSTAPFPVGLEREMRAVFAIAERVKSPQATVEDAAEATIRLYSLLSRMENRLYDGEWYPMEVAASDEDMEEIELAFEGVPQGTGLEGDEIAYTSPQQVDYRGEFKPELVQLIARLKGEQSADEAAPASPLTPEQLKELIEKSAEIDLATISPGDLSSAVGLFLSNLMDDVYQQAPVSRDGDDVDRGDADIDERSLEEEERSFLYDEWDFRANDYKPRWCRVLEKNTVQGNSEFFETTMRNHARLAAQIKRQFELIAPELFKKIKRLHDGDDFDLDAVIEAMVEKRAGVTPSDKIYWRRNKVERDVSVVFLLDISASTSEAIEEEKRVVSDEWDFNDMRSYMSWLRMQREEMLAHKSRKIIDVEKESLVLLIGALETIGDDYGIYGFSGYGRDNVEFFVVKDIAEGFSETVKRRIDGLTPLHATRMGPAIRHAASKLESRNAKTKILFLISDGRPQDHGYGRDSMEKDYAINDTKMALLEARRKGITPFCLTVDKMGQDYLKKMCHDIGYEVVWNIESLPRRLPALYRRLTT
ncbi:MAG: VWA domain-containing protein [Chloroflexota bacterium]|nr:VWA domain-containing protein [Chloroflexota bacterium]